MTPVTQSYGSVSLTTLEYNLLQFNQKRKVFKQNIMPGSCRMQQHLRFQILKCCSYNILFFPSIFPEHFSLRDFFLVCTLSASLAHLPHPVLFRCPFHSRKLRLKYEKIRTTSVTVSMSKTNNISHLLYPYSLLCNITLLQGVIHQAGVSIQFSAFSFS